jgi:hypothetical protein
VPKQWRKKWLWVLRRIQLCTAPEKDLAFLWGGRR